MFEITVRLKNASVDDDVDRLLSEFLIDIGYIEERGEKNIERMKENVSFRLFKEVFLMRPEKTWPVNEILTFLNTSKPTLYRHLNRLKSLEIIQEVQIGKEKGYVLRYNSLSLAWNFVESNVKMAMDNYRKRVENIQRMVGEK
jgi:predicted transcriptional regulator